MQLLLAIPLIILMAVPACSSDKQESAASVLQKQRRERKRERRAWISDCAKSASPDECGRRFASLQHWWASEPEEARAAREATAAREAHKAYLSARPWEPQKPELSGRKELRGGGHLAIGNDKHASQTTLIKANPEFDRYVLSHGPPICSNSSFPQTAFYDESKVGVPSSIIRDSLNMNHATRIRTRALSTGDCEVTDVQYRHGVYRSTHGAWE